MKVIFPVIKAIALVLVGIFLTYLLTSVFAYVELRYFGLAELMKRCFSAQSACTNEEFYSAILEGVFRSNYVYNPVVILVVSLFLSIFQMHRRKFLLVFLSLIPFLVVHLFAGSFGVESIVLALLYLLFGIGVSLLIHIIQQRNHPRVSARQQS